MYVVGVWILLEFSVGSRYAENALGHFDPGFRRECVRRGAQGVNPAVSRRAGPTSTRNERRECLGEPVLLFLRDHRTCPRKDSSYQWERLLTLVIPIGSYFKTHQFKY